MYAARTGGPSNPGAPACVVVSPGRMRFVLVGGAVRDMLLGRRDAVADEDYLVLDAGREALLARFPKAAEVGTRATAFMVNGRELSLPRAGAAPDFVTRAEAPLHQDLSGRDLTINALAVDEDGMLYAHPQALEDVRSRVLRPCSASALLDDPVRALRAARLAAQMPDFKPHPDLLSAMRDASASLASVASERVAKETIKALAAPKPSVFFSLLANTGCLQPWFAELGTADAVPAGPMPYHKGSLLRHLGRVLDNLAVMRPGDSLAGWMALTHDLGKAATDPGHWPKHHNHDIRGEDLARSLAQRLGVPNAYARAGTLAARWHMLAACYARLRPGTRVDLLDILHKGGVLERMFALVEADVPEEGPEPIGLALLALAREDLRRILEVRLPPKDQNQGEWSGKRLRELRCLALREK